MFLNHKLRLAKDLTNYQIRYNQYMKTDITRQISASVYQNISLRDTIYQFVKDPYHAVIDSYGLDIAEVLKHTFNSRKKEKSYFQLLFLPSILFWLFLIISIFSEMGVFFLLGVIAFIVAYIIVLVRDINTKKFLKQNFSKNSYNSNFNYDEDSAHYISNYISRTNGNAIFYSGFSPFVGSGFNIGGWSLVVDIDKGKCVMGTKSTPFPFKCSELYEAISNEMSSLHLPNLLIKDKVFIDGKTIRDNNGLLPNQLGPPVSNVKLSYITLVMNNDIKNSRFYKVFQVIDWEGDIVLSAFFRLQKDDKTLFIESNYYLLPPIKQEFKAIDATKKHSGIRKFIAWVLSLFYITITHTLWSIFKIFGYLTELIYGIFGGKELLMRKHVESSPDFDYGASTSIRTEVTQTLYYQHFQKLDKERYFKTIEKRLFNLIGDFLDSKNIDSSEFKEREATILNHGVIVTGGNLISENLAVGKDSKISFGKREK